MDEQTKRKQAQNEAMFREVNEDIAEVREDWGQEESRYVCECADATCALTISLSRDQYEHVRSNPRWFAVIRGHEEPELERTIEEHDTYLVVEKLVPVPEP
jgi:hypothetical protein